MSSPLIEVYEFNEVEPVAGDVWMIPVEWTYVPPKGNSPIHYVMGRWVVSGWYEMSRERPARNPYDNAGRAFFGEEGGFVDEDQIDRLVRGEASREDCDPEAFGPPDDPVERLYVDGLIGGGAKHAAIGNRIEGELCDWLRFWIDPGTCLPEHIRRCLAAEWKKTRIMLVDSPCLLPDGASFGALVHPAWGDQMHHYLVLCRTTFTLPTKTGIPRIAEVLLHELLHLCHTSEFESYVLVAHCMGVANTQEAAEMNYEDTGVNWKAVVKYWEANKKDGRLWWDKSTQRWQGRFIEWDCSTGEVWLREDDGSLTLIFPDAATGSAGIDPENGHGWGIFGDNCPPERN